MGKPVYKIPTMKEIFSQKRNGYKVVSTFSGGGGSCLGYEMAGYKILWANEFVEEAQKTYRLNHKGVYLNTQDIRTITPEQILEEAKIKKGEIDLFDGSPPCCAFSQAGSREKGWGKVRNYSDNNAQRVDDLFFEYTRILKGLQPKTFIAENVAGLVRGSAKGYFKLILEEMKNCGYEVSCRLLNACFLGVPEARERLIFIGVRKDLCEKYNVKPVHPKPFNYYYTLADAFEGLKNKEDDLNYFKPNSKTLEVIKQIPKNPPKRISASKYKDGSYFNVNRESMFMPCGTILAGSQGNIHPLEDRSLSIAELKRITSIPEDFILTGDWYQRWERLGRMVPPLMMKAISETIKTEILDKIKGE